MQNITVLPRIHKRHPEISEEDVIAAWQSTILSTPRLKKDRDEYISLGFDKKGRLLEMVSVRSEIGEWIVFHAMCPPSQKTLKEFGIERR